MWSLNNDIIFGLYISKDKLQTEYPQLDMMIMLVRDLVISLHMCKKSNNTVTMHLFVKMLVNEKEER